MMQSDARRPAPQPLQGNQHLNPTPYARNHTLETLNPYPMRHTLETLNPYPMRHTLETLNPYPMRQVVSRLKGLIDSLEAEHSDCAIVFFSHADTVQVRYPKPQTLNPKP